MPANGTRHGQDQYSSDGIRRLLLKAESILGCDPDLSQLEQVVDQIKERGGQLTEAQIAQLEELSGLLAADPQKRETAEILAQDATFQIQIAEDKMSIKLSIRPAVAGGRAVDLDDIANWLKENGATHGIDANAVESAVVDAKHGMLVSDRIIARGKLPGEPKPDRIDLFGRHSTDTELEPLDPTDQTGEPDRPCIWMCNEGDRILHYQPPEAGSNGHNVLGRPLQPPAPRPRSISCGGNVEQRDHDYIAKCAGLVVFENERIEVRRVLIIDYELTAKGPVIDFDGNVQVRSQVRNGARIKATGEISIDSSVEGAHIESTGGDIRLRHGVTGQNHGIIRAAGSIYAHFVENATLVAGEDITIDIGAMHSRLIAGRSIHLTHGRGQIIGGSAMAAKLIEAKQAGSAGGIATELSVGLSKSIMERLAVIDEQIARLQTNCNKATEIADKIKRTVGDPLNLKPREIKAYTSLRQVQLVCDIKIALLKDRRAEVLAEGVEQTQGHIDIISMYPGIVLRVGGAKHVNNQLQSRCRITFDGESKSIAVNPIR